MTVADTFKYEQKYDVGGRARAGGVSEREDDEVRQEQLLVVAVGARHGGDQSKDFVNHSLQYNQCHHGNEYWLLAHPLPCCYSLLFLIHTLT